MNILRSICCRAVAFIALFALPRRWLRAHRPHASAKRRPAFSFAVYGDSRSMMYLPYMETQKEEATNAMVDMFELVLPEKVAAGVVQKDVKLIYDPATKELVQVVMPFMTQSEVTYMTLDKGWVTEASVEDVKLLPGVRRTMFRLQGGEWVARGIVDNVKSGRAKFVLNTGDMVWWGKQGWQALRQPVLEAGVRRRVEAVASSGRANARRWSARSRFSRRRQSRSVGRLRCRRFVERFSVFEKFGVSDKRLIYKFDYNGARFIFLWTGKYDYRAPTAWDATRPAYEEQMKQLKQWLDEAKAAGTKKVFIAFHCPAFCRSGMGAIPESQNPHKLLASYAKDLDIVVFNGHVHTTEIYEVDGVKYLLLGGGGAEQDPILPGRTSIKVPAGYPPDLYWKGQPPKEEYNYLLVDVQPGQKTKFTLNRFRPWSAEPFASVELFQ